MRCVRSRAARALSGALTVAAFGAAAAFPAFAAEPEPPAKTTVLHLTQAAERRLPRDRLEVELRAEKTADTPRAVEAAINALMAKALAEARGAAGVEVATGSYAVYRVGPATAPPQWTGQQGLSLTGSDFDRLLGLAGRLQGEGLVASAMNYTVSHQSLRRAEDALTKQALAELRQRAAAIAQDMHMTVAGYRDVTVGNAETGGGPMPRFALAAKATGMPAPVGAAGEAIASVAVNADVLLAPARP